MPELSVTIDGRHVPLAECDWVMWGPCGCPVAVCTTRIADDITATEEQAWRRFYTNKKEIAKEKKLGFTMGLVTHARWSEEISHRFGKCSHPEPAP